MSNLLQKSTYTYLDPSISVAIAIFVTRTVSARPPQC
jgi:hypothetical protein